MKRALPSWPSTVTTVINRDITLGIVCLQKQQDAKRGKPLQSNQQQHQRLKDLQVEVKALALKLERSAAPNNKTKKAKAQVKAAS
jgi:hypothetical protein